MAGNGDTTVRFKADISQLKSQMQAAERQIKLVNSEFKAATAGMDNWSKSADGLSAKTKQLSGVLDGQNKKLELMEKELEATVKAYGENSAAADRVRIKINEQKAAIANTESQLKKYSDQLEDLQKGMDKAADGTQEFESATDKLKSSISDQESKLESLKKHYSDLVAGGDELSDEAKQTAKEISELSTELKENKDKLSDAEKAADEFDNSLEEVDDSAQKASDGFSVMKGALADLVADGIRATISAIKDLAKETFEVGSNFESAMSQVAAVSGAGADEMEQLTAKAEEMGAKTKFSATESADAFNYMAMAGWKTNDMLEGIEGIMNLAAASGSDLATASDIVTDALTAMGYEAKDAGRLADVMAAAASNANTNVEMMGGTFKYVAPVAGALGYSMEDTSVAIGLMANSGIKAEKAGTALRSIFTRLSTDAGASSKKLGALGTLTEKLGVEFYNADGTCRELSDVLVDARAAWAGLSEEQQVSYGKTIAGQEALSGWLALMNSSDADFNKLTNAINESAGAAENMANVMNDNVGGQMTLLKSKIEGIMIKLFNRAKDSMRDGIETFSEALDKVNWDKVGDAIGNIANKAADLFSYVINNSDRVMSVLRTIGTVIGTVFIANKITTYGTAVAGLISVFTKCKSVSEGFATAVKLLGINMNALPIMAVIGAMAALYSYAKAQEQQFKANAEAAYGLSKAEKELIKDIERHAEEEEKANQARKETGEGIDVEYGQISKLKDQYNDLIDENGNVKEGYEDLATVLLDDLANALGITVEDLEKNIDANGKLGKSIDDLIEKKKLEAKISAFEPDYQEALKNEIKYFQELKSAKDADKNAQDDLTTAQQEYNDAIAQLEKFPSGNIPMQVTDRLAQASENLTAAKQKVEETGTALQTAAQNWGTAQNMIENYQTAMSASTEGNAEKMNDAVLSIQYGIKNSTVANEEELKKQWFNTQKELEDIQELYEQGGSGVTTTMIAQYKRVNEIAANELKKYTDQNKKAGADGITGLNDGLKAGVPKVSVTAGELGLGSKLALFNNMGDWRDIADEKTGAYMDALDGATSTANKQAAKIAEAEIKALQDEAGGFTDAAKNAVDGYVNEISAHSNDLTDSGSFVGKTTAKAAAEQAVEFITAADDSAKGYTSTLDSHTDDYTKSGVLAGGTTAKGALSTIKQFDSAGESSSNEYTNAIDSKRETHRSSGRSMVDSTADGASSQASALRSPGTASGDEFVGGVDSKKESAYNAGAGLASQAASGADSKQGEARTSGHYFGQGFVDGIGDFFEKVWEKAKELAKRALDGLNAGLKENSPSKLTHQSGRYFSIGFMNGIHDETKNAVYAATVLGVSAIKALQDAQQEGSPSKLTYKSGKNFTQGYINGIASLEKELAKTTNNMVKTIVKQTMLSSSLKKIENAASKAGEAFSKGITKKVNYISSYMAYKNEKMIADFDKTIESLQKESNKKVAEEEKKSQQVQNTLTKQINAIKKVSESQRTKEQKQQLKSLEKQLSKEQKALEKATTKIQNQYNKQIRTQENIKAAYQRAASSMMSEFNAAMADYQTAAQDLIDSTIGNITSKYNEKYDALIGKQNDLISKLKEAGNIFNLSDANILTTADLKEQTREITNYAKKLQKIKKKVSSDLYDQITTYDMKEGTDFINRLLKMSDKELTAYNKAYDKKIKTAEKLSKQVYSNDFKQLNKEYQNEINTAFKGLDKKLEKIGKDCLKGFVQGLTDNTSYMDKSIKTFIDGMIKTFKKELGIKSPSKVTKKLGAYTAEGFADGITANADMVTAAIDNMTSQIEKSFDFTRLSSIDGFTSALEEFEDQAKDTLIKTLNNIGTTYQTKFNELISKRDNLSKKLKGTSNLYTLSSANVMKLVDLNAEIKQMQDYTSALTKIKGKVSSALFDEITSYDMKEGKAFVERLLSMSDKQLKAYSKSYDKKLSLSDQLANNVYKSDLDKVAKKYDAAIEKAFAKLPKQLKTIGTQTMQGFIKGLGSDGKYLKSSITSIVNNIVDTFKKQLKISSPSKVMEELGEYTGEGFADGLMSMVKAVKDAAEEITDTVTSSLDWQSEIDGARGTIQTAAGATGINRSAGTFEGAGTQVINFNQTNNSPKALDRLTLYRQTNNLIFGAKVRLADV